MSALSTLGAALRRHWPEYAIEAAGIALFMASALCFSVWIEHPSSPLRTARIDSLARRALMGTAMGLTAIALVYSPWGKRSGAHFNPALTFTFLRLGRVAPGDLGKAVAFGAEVAISFGLMLTVRVSTNAPRTARYTGLFAGLLVAGYITLEAPLSGMSMNPARSLGSATGAGLFASLWIYFTAPPLGMLLAAETYIRILGPRRVRCAKLHHQNRQRCIFRCGYASAA